MALQASCSSSPAILHKMFHNPYPPSLSIKCISLNPFPSPNSGGCSSLIHPIKLRRRVQRALADDACVASNDLKEEDSMSSEPLVHGVPEGDGESTEQGERHGVLDNNEMIRICDKLIGVLLVDKPTPAEWRRLLVFSNTWGNIRSHFFTHCKDQANAEDDPGMKQTLLRLGRKLKGIDEDVQRHNELLDAICGAPSEIHEIVVRRRKDFTKEFFEHVQYVAESFYDDPEHQKAIANLRKKCLVAVLACDTASGSMEAPKSVELLQLKDISPIPDAAGRKIDFLAEKNRLGSASMQVATKAWVSTPETPMTKDEANDLTFHMYKSALKKTERELPKEVRILKYLVAIKDPEKKLSCLKDAFTPGDEVEGEEVDMVYTTPKILLTWIKVTVDVYYSRAEESRSREVRGLMKPRTIQKLVELKKLIEDNFL
ncbi:hypothetical protein Dimus_004973 [Dionaea muscipula]